MKNDLLLQAAAGKLPSRPPVWLMRQAGRILPEYRAVRAQAGDFKTLVTTPELACQVTLQPVDLLGVDAAIIFSDILVVPEALGLDYEMIEAKGPNFPQTVRTLADVTALRSPAEAADALEYVYEALRLTRRALNERVSLIGFAGAPWTLFAYMTEGRGSKTFSIAKKILYTNTELSLHLLDLLTETTILYLRKQVEAGAQLLQVFDSWAGLLSPELYARYATPYLRRICEAIPEVPITLFAKGAHFALADFATMPCSVIGIDWTLTPQAARQLTNDARTLQGNFDPCLLYAPAAVIEEAVSQAHASFARPHIFNLGHGVYPDTPLDGVKAFIAAVKGLSYA